MLQQTLRELFIRDLKKLETEIAAYKHEQKIWYTEKGIANSAGNLCLHLVGNLNTFIGAELGNTGYVRYRDLEFSRKDVPREELIKMVRDTTAMVSKTLEQLTAEQIAGNYPIPVFDKTTSVEFFLIHLAGHLNYHLGQINYHRRLLDEVE